MIRGVERGWCSGAVRAGIIGSHSAFPGGGPARVCGNDDERRDGERNSATNITLFLDRGVLRDERGGGSAGLMHPFAWIIAAGPTTLHPPPVSFPTFFRPFPSPFRACSLSRPPSFSNNVKCIVCLRSYLRRRWLPNYFTEHPCTRLEYSLSIGCNYERCNIHMHGSLCVASNVKHLVLR